MALIIEILKRAQKHIVNRKKGASQATEETKASSAEGGEVDISNEINLDIDISLRNDEKLQSLLEVIAQIQRKLVRLGEEPVLTFLSTLEGQIAGYLLST
jgi:hypothetical protein